MMVEDNTELYLWFTLKKVSDKRIPKNIEWVLVPFPNSEYISISSFKTV